MCAVGKWNLGYSKWKYTPTMRGFHKFVGYLQKHIDYWHYSADKSCSSNVHMGLDLWYGKKIFEVGLSEKTYTTEFFTGMYVCIYVCITLVV